MWIVLGFVVAAVIGLAVVLALAGPRTAAFDSHPWLLDETAKSHVNILAGLAGFAFTGVVLVVTLVRDRTAAGDTALDIVITMFLVAYLWWIGGAFLISFLPSAEAAGGLAPRVHFSLATTLEYRTVFLSWFALLPLLQANGFGRLAPVLDFLLPASLLCGSVLVSMASDGLGLLRVWETYLSALVAIVIALAYAGLVAFVIPAAHSRYGPLYLALVVFCINGLGFALACLTPLSRRYPGVGRFFERHGRRIVVADMQLTMAALVFLWLSVVGVL
ncbi:MAG TPA: hypothetical protein VGH15_14675 [Caulobacteraceae bacterium]|jgi:hypothetical protein